MIINDIIEKTAQKYGEKTGLIFKDQTFAFDSIREHSFKLANALRGCGAKKGDRIGIYLPNCPEYVFSYLAIFCLGAVGVPLDFMLKEDELVSCLGHSETKILIALNKSDVDLEAVWKQLPQLEKLILLDGNDFDAVCYGDLMAHVSSEFLPVDIKDSDPALIMYTSGTTGKPKGILLNYKHLDGSPKAMEYFVDLTDKDIKLCPLPLSHIGGFIYIQNMLLFGITLVLMDRFNPMHFLENVHKYNVTCFHIVPPMYNAILTLKHIENFDLSSLRWVVVFGAPSSPEILERFHKYCLNAVLLNGWGMTETCPPNTVTPLKNSDNIASVGKPSPFSKIRIVGDDGKDMSACAIGEIVISGEYIMQEYYKDPEATAEMKRPDGLYTGDLGRFDENGFLYIVGRKKEMIKVGGQLVYAPEVEAALYKHPAVVEAAVIGVPDKLRGETIKAFVVLKEGESVNVDDLREFMKEHLAHFKVPSSIEIVKDLPKNRTGKIDKVVLQKKI
ncbi:MAG: AMP-binding protein [Candidatus Omnitrophica bacterium]|nr:AMP-binding protein [Candidatus Omnitrophota bacterium]